MQIKAATRKDEPGPRPIEPAHVDPPARPVPLSHSLSTVFKISRSPGTILINNVSDGHEIGFAIGESPGTEGWGNVSHRPAKSMIPPHTNEPQEETATKNRQTRKPRKKKLGWSNR